MGPADIPAEFNKPKTSQVEYFRSAFDAFDKLLSDSQSSPMEKFMSKPGSSNEIVDHGQIQRISLPRDWVEGKSSEGGVGTRSWREVHPTAAPDATLCFYYRGKAMKDESAKNFQEVLSKPPHVLSQSEIKSVSEALRGKDDPKEFSAVMVRTEEINGKKVLTITGRMPQTQEDVHAVLVDAKGDGKNVQEIYFQAPKDLYLKYGKDAKEAIKSIEWK